MLPHTGLFLLWKVALQMRIRSLLDGSLSVVEPAPFDGVSNFPVRLPRPNPITLPVSLSIRMRKWRHSLMGFSFLVY
ncbi:hypothetical protein [Neisseria sicca]|uniref:hypothetical protein n=1 Tax=Neisseria sicca TaxID=490 RepID=UPI0011AEB518|nr:hypothetical protein [Neisseria sicca]